MDEGRGPSAVRAARTALDWLLLMIRFSTGACGGKLVRWGFALAVFLAAATGIRSATAQVGHAGGGWPTGGGANQEPQKPPEGVQKSDDEPPPPWHYETKNVNPALSADQRTILQILKAGKFQGNQQTFDDFYTQYFLARWTLEENLKNLAWNQVRAVPGPRAGGAAPPHPNYRAELRSHFRSTSGEVYGRLNELVLDFMKELVAGNYHPAVRVNAMLAVGELTQEPVEHNAAPLPEALKVLVAAVKNSELPDCVRVAAMTGILRHAEADIDDDEARKSVVAVMLSVSADELKLKKAQVQDWFVGQAMTGLGSLGSVGERQAAFQAIVKTIADSKRSFGTRSIAVESLGQLDYADADGIDVADTAATLVQFAINACDEESKVLVDRGRIKQRIEIVSRALNGSGGSRKGIRSLVKDEGQAAHFKELNELLRRAGDDLDDPEKIMDAISTVETLRAALDDWLKKKPE
jgi:hypothetical protein